VALVTHSHRTPRLKKEYSYTSIPRGPSWPVLGWTLLFLLLLENYLTPDSLYCFNGRIIGSVVKITRENSECDLY